MFIGGLLKWWYGPGWRERSVMVGSRIARVYDFFSIDLLVRTWFAPFRQISAGKVQGNISIQFRAFLDKLFSRVIGGIVRTCTIVVGSLVLAVTCIVAAIELLLWFAVPVFPIIGAIMYAIGWVPHVTI